MATRIAPTRMYVFHPGWCPCACWCSAGAPVVCCTSVVSCAMASVLLDEVHEREDHDPDDVDEVPVQRREVDGERVAGLEPATVVDRQQGAEPEHAGGDVRAVEAREREE